uniref:Uncharacterized protein n=1 Tax=Scophthalmus maximus TaxID=52904 RepID=A0A8D3BLY4_SCOMX
APAAGRCAQRLRTVRTGCHFFRISMFLLLIFLQMSASLVFSAGVFVLSDDVLISPFRMCLTDEYGELHCYPEIKMNFLNFLITAVILALYVPVVLVAFALLAMLLTAHTRDRAVLWLSMACQAASSVLILTGLIAFLLLNQPYATWENMTIWFYMCVGVQVELMITTVLTRVSERKLTSDWT